MEYSIAGISIIVLVLGIVEAAKKLGVEGKGSFVLALATGFVFGVFFYVIDNGLLPPAAVPWVEGVVFGLSFGLAATGLYDLGKKP